MVVALSRPAPLPAEPRAGPTVLSCPWMDCSQQPAWSWVSRPPRRGVCSLPPACVPRGPDAISVSPPLRGSRRTRPRHGHQAGRASGPSRLLPSSWHQQVSLGRSPGLCPCVPSPVLRAEHLVGCGLMDHQPVLAGVLLFLCGDPTCKPPRSCLQSCPCPHCLQGDLRDGVGARPSGPVLASPAAPADLGVSPCPQRRGHGTWT